MRVDWDSRVPEEEIGGGEVVKAVDDGAAVFARIDGVVGDTWKS